MEAARIHDHSEKPQISTPTHPTLSSCFYASIQQSTIEPSTSPGQAGLLLTSWHAFLPDPTTISRQDANSLTSDGKIFRKPTIPGPHIVTPHTLAIVPLEISRRTPYADSIQPFSTDLAQQKLIVILHLTSPYIMSTYPIHGMRVGLTSFPVLAPSHSLHPNP